MGHHHNRNMLVNGTGSSNQVHDQQSPGSGTQNKTSQSPKQLFEQNGVCFCSRFLNPFSNYGIGNGHCIVTPNNLQHYCRVCNIQLNSCRQAKIHSTGKKHEKRLNYLRFCMESSTDSADAMAFMQQGDQSGLVISMETPPPSYTAPVPQTQTIQSVQAPMSLIHPQTCTTIPPPVYPVYPAAQPAATVVPSAPAPAVTGSGGGGLYQHPPPQTTGSYYYPVTTSSTAPSATGMNQGMNPGVTYHTVPPPPPPPPHGYAYNEYSMTVPIMEQSPAPVATLIHQPPPLTMLQGDPSTNGNHQHFTTNSNGQVMYHCNVMSPSLTSGFSGSGGDCKSTETSSILSTASYSSVPNKHHHHHKKRSGHHCSVEKMMNESNMNGNCNQSTAICNGGMGKQKTCKGKQSTDQNSSMIHNSAMSNNPLVCEVCQLPFPSKAVLENHLSGNRHARRVKSQQALKQLHESGVQFHHEEGVSEMRCEVCSMSVNSSHQLQAHLLGHKHRVRAVRRGVKLNQAIILPSSSADATTSASGASSESGNEPSNNPTVSVDKNHNTLIMKSTGNGSGNSLTSSSRHRRSSALIVPSNMLSNSTKSAMNSLNGPITRRHRSSGCLSKHCSHSTLSLSTSRNRARSSSGLNKLQSRSMNLLSIHTEGFANSAEPLPCCKKADVDTSSTDEGYDPDFRKKKHQRPRSYSTRTAKDGEMGKNEKNLLLKQSDENCSSPLSNNTLRRRGKPTKSASIFKKVPNGKVASSTGSKIESGVNGNILNTQGQPQNQHSKTYSKQGKTTVKVNGKTNTNVEENSTTNNKTTTNNSNNKKLRNIPMLGVFLEGLSTNGTSDGNATNGSANGTKQETNKKKEVKKKPLRPSAGSPSVINNAAAPTNNPVAAIS